MPDNNSAKEEIELLKGLRQVRAFRPDPVPQAIIDDILEVARWSGSASNRQEAEYVVIRNHNTLQTLGDVNGSPSHLSRAPLGIAIVIPTENPEMVAYDEGRVTERIMLAAKAHGLGAGIWWLKGEAKTNAPKTLNLPEGKQVRTAISIGYPDESGNQSSSNSNKGRKPISELAHEEKY